MKKSTKSRKLTGKRAKRMSFRRGVSSVNFILGSKLLRERKRKGRERSCQDRFHARRCQKRSQEQMGEVCRLGLQEKICSIKGSGGRGGGGGLGGAERYGETGQGGWVFPRRGVWWRNKEKGGNAGAKSKRGDTRSFKGRSLSKI